MEINQHPILPKFPLPIAIIGSGGIIRDAHLPAYTMAGFSVLGLFDRNTDKAKSLQSQFGIVQHVYDTLDQLISEAVKIRAIYDLAVPASEIIDILKRIPDGSAILIQKPMGNTLSEAKQIAKICMDKQFKAGVNFQLRYAPYMIAAHHIMDLDLLGKIHDMEMVTCVCTPWHLWDFMSDLPRMEILYHSIHYLDLIRSFLGMPKKIYASTIKHPNSPNLASSKSTIILHYHDFLQARIITNHGHDFGPKHETSMFKIEGTNGAIKIQVGLSLDYPNGRPPKFEYIVKGVHMTWQELPLIGGWFPHAFIGTMAGLQNHVLESTPLPHDINASLDTMKLVEAAYQSSETGGIKLSDIT